MSELTREEILRVRYLAQMPDGTEQPIFGTSPRGLCDMALRCLHYERDLFDTEHKDRSQDVEWLRTGFLQRGAEIERLEQRLQEAEEERDNLRETRRQEIRATEQWRERAQEAERLLRDVRPEIESLIAGLQYSHTAPDGGVHDREVAEEISQLQALYERIEQSIAAHDSGGQVPDNLLYARLPVDVGIPPNGTIREGCAVRTLLLALVRRGMEEWREPVEASIRREHGEASHSDKQEA